MTKQCRYLQPHSLRLHSAATIVGLQFVLSRRHYEAEVEILAHLLHSQLACGLVHALV